MKKNNTSQLKLIYSLTCIALLPILGLSAYYIHSTRIQSIEDKVKKLHSVALSKQITLENHLDSYITSMKIMAKNKALVDSLSKNDYSNNSLSLLRDFQESMWGSSHHVFIADTKGHIVVSPHHGDNLKSTHVNHSIHESKYFKDALKSIQVTDFFGFEETNHYHQLVMIPIVKDGVTLGVLISEITIQHYIDLLKKDFDLGKTGEIYLVTLDKQKVVHGKDKEIEVLDSEVLNTAFEKSFAYGEDIAGKRNHLVSFLKSDKFPWLLAVEVSRDEVLAPINHKTKVISVIYFILVIIFLFVFRFIIRLLKKPVREISLDIEKITKQTSDNVKTLEKGAEELVGESLKLAEAITENQGQLDRVIGAIKKDTDVINESLAKSDLTKTTAEKGEQAVNDMGRNVDLTVSSNEEVQSEVSDVMVKISEIADSIKTIQEKTTLINDIVFQTKLLSFNASVEAARAGEHGKGFSVVAEEIGNLAAMSGNASVEIHEMIEESVNKVEQIVGESKRKLNSVLNDSKNKTNDTKESIKECKALFDDILTTVKDVHQNVTIVSSSATENVDVIDEVNSRFIELRNVSSSSSEIANTVNNLTIKLKDSSVKLSETSKELKTKFST